MELSKLEGMIPQFLPHLRKWRTRFRNIKKREEIRYLLNTGINVISATRSTGEGVSISDKEIKIIVETIKNENKIVFLLLRIACIIRNSIKDAIKTEIIVKEAEADALFVTSVFYFGATKKGNYEYYHSISQEVDLPIIIYNVIPTNQIAPKAMLKLSEIEEVVGIKQVDINTLPEMVSFCGNRINIYSAVIVCFIALMSVVHVGQSLQLQPLLQTYV